MMLSKSHHYDYIHTLQYTNINICEFEMYVLYQ